MPGLISRQIKSHNKGRGIFVCDYCLNHFGTQVLLDRHEESCSKYKAVKTEYPGPDYNILSFKNIQNCIKCPVKFYFDTESILKPIDEMRVKTRLNQRHVMSAFCLYPVFRIEGVFMEPIRTWRKTKTTRWVGFWWRQWWRRLRRFTRDLKSLSR